MPSEIYSQAPHRIRLARGREGAKESANRKHILVVIDTLSFSTSAVTAVHHAAQLSVYESVPYMQEDCLTRYK